MWQQSGLSYGEVDELLRRTLHNRRKTIKGIFDIYIECDVKDGYRLHR
jgi:hypothetical protein